MWGNIFNLSGLYSQTPLKLKKGETTWWTPDGEMHFEKEGLDIKDGCVRFMSANKKEVEAWTKGVLSVQIIIVNMCGGTLRC